MIINIDTVVKRFIEFNDLYFNGDLFGLKISTMKSTRMYGHCRVRKGNVEIRINQKIDFKDETSWENTLIHEMIHAYQWKKHKHMNHGLTFKKYSKMIEEKTNGKYIITRTSSDKGFFINEKIIKSNKNEHVFVMVNRKVNTHRVFRKTPIEDLKLFAKKYNFELYEYNGNVFTEQKSASLHTRTFSMFYNRNNELELLENEGLRII